ncbi:MAG TPA: hypothetical protein VH497_02865 [Vicinamibacterales bacterium]
MPARRPIGNALVATAILIVATLAVGLSAGADGPFSIAVRPVFLRLGVDLDVKLGSVHLHANWSALPDPPQPSTKTAPDQL